MQEMGHTAYDTLQELADQILTSHRIEPAEMTLEQVVEGLRRLLRGLEFGSAGSAEAEAEEGGSGVGDAAAFVGSRFSRAEVTDTAQRLLEQAGIEPAPTAAVSPIFTEGKMFVGPVPLWLSLPIYVMQAASKPALLMFGLRSRMVRVEGYGVFHFYDSGGPVSRTAAAPTATGPVPEPPVVLVHGMFTNGLSMVLVAAMLAKAGRRVIVPDLLCSDFGGSVALPGFENKVANHKASLVALINTLGLSTFTLLGHSFGGFLVQELAEAFVQAGGEWRLRSLVLLCPGGGNRYWPARSGRTIVGGLTHTAEIFRSLPRPVAILVATIFRLLLRTPTQASLLGDLFIRDHYFLKFQRIRCPTLLLWGNMDHVIEPRGADVQLKYLEQGTGFWLEGGSHAINLDAASTVHAVADPFLSSVAAGADGVAAAQAATNAATLVASQSKPLSLPEGALAASISSAGLMHKRPIPMVEETGVPHSRL